MNFVITLVSYIKTNNLRKTLYTLSKDLKLFIRHFVIYATKQFKD